MNKREIKFRAWSDSKKKMYMPTDEATAYNDPDGYFVAGNGLIPNDYCEDGMLMQFTGIKDLDGKEIYEGDIVSFENNITADDIMGFEPNGFFYDESDKYPVIWSQKYLSYDLDYGDYKFIEEYCEWKWRRDTHWLLMNGKCEVVGNIYQNPKLLK